MRKKRLLSFVPFWIAVFIVQGGADVRLFAAPEDPAAFYRVEEISISAANKLSRVEIIPEVNHMLYHSHTGCVRELMEQVQSGRPDFAPTVMKRIEVWLEELKKYFGTDTQLREEMKSGLEERIVYHAYDEGNAEIYSMRPDGGDVRRLTHSPAEDSCPVISPDGRKIVFISSRDGNDEIYVMDPDGGNPTRLTRTAYNEGPPRWTPDGRKIISWVINPPENAGGNIFVIDSDGTNIRWLTRPDCGGASPDFSADGRWILYEAKHDGRFELWVMNADGSDQRQLTRSPGDKLLAKWSPEGERITYTEVVDFRTSHTRVHVMDSDGSDDRVVADEGLVNEDSSWSPDGQKLVFQSSRDGNYEIYIIDSDGRNPKRLTNTPTMENYPSWGRCQKKNSFPVLKVPYFGQMPLGMTPELFAPGIVSTGLEETVIAFMPDGNECY